MNAADYIPIREAAQLEGVEYKAFQKRCERKRVALVADPEDGRCKLFPISALSPKGGKAWQDSVTKAAFEGMKAKPQTEQAIMPASSGAPQSLLPFAPPSPSQPARDVVIAAVPEKQRSIVDRWMEEIAQNANGTWKLYRGKEYNGTAISHRGDYIRARAALIDVSVSTYRSKLALARQVLQDPEVPKASKWARIAELLVPKPRPGLSGHDYFSNPREEVAWQFPTLRGFYLNQARLSVKAAYELLCELIDQKQRAWGLECIYPRPTLGQCRTALAKIPKPQLVLAREGEKAYNDQCAPFFSRDYAPLASNDIWVTDQREVDVRLRDGGERLGRMWMVNFLDVASLKVLGYSFGPVLNSDMVMQAATIALELYGVPAAVQMDLGKEFTCKAFNGSMRKLSGEALYREAKGLWDRLGVRVIKAIGRNPQTKPIERWHQIPAKWEKNFAGWCGSNTQERPEKLALEEAQHAAWLKGEALRTPLVRISDYIRAYIAWVENEWNAKHRGRGKVLCGMTPNEAFNAKRPAEGFRRISVEELDHASAEHRFLRVSRGGQVNLTFYGQTLEYLAPELFNLIGEEVEVIVSRRTFRRITVIYPVTGGSASCIAELKPQFKWVPETHDELRAAMRCRAAVRRAINQGHRASDLVLEAANPIELLAAVSEQAKPPVARQKLFGAPGHPEMGSLEYFASRRERPRIANERAAAVIKAMEEETAHVVRAPRRITSSELARRMVELQSQGRARRCMTSSELARAAREIQQSQTSEEIARGALEIEERE